MAVHYISPWMSWTIEGSEHQLSLLFSPLFYVRTLSFIQKGYRAVTIDRGGERKIKRASKTPGVWWWWGFNRWFCIQMAKLVHISTAWSPCSCRSYLGLFGTKLYAVVVVFLLVFRCTQGQKKTINDQGFRYRDKDTGVCCTYMFTYLKILDFLYYIQM